MAKRGGGTVFFSILKHKGWEIKLGKTRDRWIWEIKGTGDDPDELQAKILEINTRFKDTLLRRTEEEGQ